MDLLALEHGIRGQVLGSFGRSPGPWAVLPCCQDLERLAGEFLPYHIELHSLSDLQKSAQFCSVTMDNITALSYQHALSKLTNAHMLCSMQAWQVHKRHTV